MNEVDKLAENVVDEDDQLVGCTGSPLGWLREYVMVLYIHLNHLIVVDVFRNVVLTLPVLVGLSIFIRLYTTPAMSNMQLILVNDTPSTRHTASLVRRHNKGTQD